MHLQQTIFSHTKCYLQCTLKNELFKSSAISKIVFINKGLHPWKKIIFSRANLGVVSWDLPKLILLPAASFQHSGLVFSYFWLHLPQHTTVTGLYLGLNTTMLYWWVRWVWFLLLNVYALVYISWKILPQYLFNWSSDKNGFPIFGT